MNLHSTGPLLAVSDDPTAELPNHRLTDLFGRLLLGRYLVNERLAVGGMAEVYLATHGTMAGFQTPVVIKRILPNLAHSREFIEMFLDEARVAALIQHPNVATVLEVGKEREEYFLAMELVQGESLSQIIRTLNTKQIRMSPPLAAYIASQIAAGLHHAHTICDPTGQPLHVVHRDVSPQNILISYEGAVKVIDFGIVRALGRATNTRVGSAKGKFSYMSPEQARRETVDLRSDIFSLGVVLWEMVTGIRLFRRENEMDTVDAILGETPAPLSDHVPVSPQLQSILDRALTKDPNERFPSAFEMETLLQQFIATEGVAGPPELRRFMRQHFTEQQSVWRHRVRRALSRVTPTPEITPVPVHHTPSPVALPSAFVSQPTEIPPKKISNGLWVTLGAAILVVIAALLGSQYLFRSSPKYVGASPSPSHHPVVNPILVPPTQPPPAPAAVDPVAHPTLSPNPTPPRERTDIRKRGKVAGKKSSSRKTLKPNPFGF